MLDKEKIRWTAKRVKDRLKDMYGITEFNNPFSIISKMPNYILIRFEGDSEVQGFTMKKGDYRCIYINSNDILVRQNYSLWHEFYHSIDNRLDEEGLIELSLKNSDELVEKEAEYFASCMLLDDVELKDFIRVKYNNINEIIEEDLIDIQYKFGVSYKAIQVKLGELYGQNFFRFTINRIENRKKYIEAIEKKGYSLEIVTATKDFCIPYSYKEGLIECLKNGIISYDKAENSIEFLNGKGVEFKWE